MLPGRLRRLLLHMLPLLGILAFALLLALAYGDWRLLAGVALSLGTNILTICWIESHPELVAPPTYYHAPRRAHPRRP